MQITCRTSYWNKFRCAAHIKNGKFNKAVDSLYKKGLGAYFSLRNTIDRRFIKARCISKLFDSLVEPILTYGCQIWLPTLPIMKKLVNRFRHDGNIDITAIAKQPFEQVQLRHLKYLLGINRRSANCAAWGETGKYPLTFSCLKLCIKYLHWAMAMPSTSFVRAALNEQIQLDLPWFQSLKSLLECVGNISPAQYNTNSSSVLNAARLLDLCPPSKIAASMNNSFVESWKGFIEGSSKLSFYNSVKSDFSWEKYLDHAWTFNDRRATARLRCSSHKLKCEVGRHKNIPKEERLCDHCKDNCVPNPPIEDENHLLHTCPLGDYIRTQFSCKFLQITSRPHDSNIAAIYLPARDADHEGNPDHSSDRSTSVLTEEEIHAIQLSAQFLNTMYKLLLNRKKDISERRKTSAKNLRQ